MSSINIVRDNSTGENFIPSTQRPDGTWRKPIRVKDGYVPQEEQPLYQPKGVQRSKDTSMYPVGLSPQDLQSGNSKNSGGIFFEVGLYKPTVPIPGLNYMDGAEVAPIVVSHKKKSKKGTKKSEGDNSSGGGGGGGGMPLKQSENNVKKNPEPLKPVQGQGQTDPAKRLRNLRKRLKDIESLESRIESGELKQPEKDQIEKVKRKEEVVDEIEELERFLERLNC